MKRTMRKQLSCEFNVYCANNCEGDHLCWLLFPCSFEKAARYEQVYPKVLNNLATTYFRLGERH